METYFRVIKYDSFKIFLVANMEEERIEVIIKLSSLLAGRQENTKVLINFALFPIAGLIISQSVF